MEGNTVAKIALQAATYAIDKPYDYQVPPELLDTLRPGMRVVVPFGAGNRRTEGIVLALEGGYIKTDRNMATNLPGVFAAGDCTGLPLQVSKAVGEGQVAGHRASEYVDTL